MERKKDENTGLDAGMNETDDTNDTDQTNGTSSEQRGAWSQSTQNQRSAGSDSDNIAPARTGTSGDWQDKLGGQGEMIDPANFPGQQSEADPAYFDPRTTPDSNTDMRDGHSGGGYAGSPAGAPDAASGSERRDIPENISGDRSAQDYQDNQKGRNDSKGR